MSRGFHFWPELQQIKAFGVKEMLEASKSLAYFIPGCLFPLTSSSTYPYNPTLQNH